MRGFYRKEISIYLNEDIIPNKGKKHSRIHYGEIPENTYEIFSDFETVFNNKKFGQLGIGIGNTLFTRTPFLTYYNYNGFCQKISKQSFKWVKVITNYKMIASVDATEISNLNAEELKEWCTDTGIGLYTILG